MAQNRKARILIVDNDPDYPKSLKAFFELEGFEVVVAGSLEEGLKALQEAAPDLVISDLRLVNDGDPEDISGFEILKAARERNLPRILTSSQLSPDIARIVLRHVGAEPLAVDIYEKRQGPITAIAAVELALGRPGYQ